MVITKTKTAGKKEAFSTNVEIRLVYFGSFFLLGATLRLDGVWQIGPLAKRYEESASQGGSARIQMVGHVTRCLLTA